jgi:hypothetical protein
MPLCKHCGSSNVERRGYTKSGRIKIKCREESCKNHPYSKAIEIKNKGSKNTYRSARILLLDIETSLMKFYGFNPKTEYIPHDLMIADWSVLCWGAKWLFEPEIMGQSVTPKESMERDDRSVLGGIWKLINEADIVITQNGIQFDLKKLNSRFLLAGYNPPTPYMNVDTLKVSREVFGWSYNRLDFLGTKFGIGKKSDMEIEDWIRCSEGSQEHLTKMFEYCKRDVAPLLEDVYLHMLPWIKGHPNLGLYTDHDADVCPKCQSQNLKWGEKYPTPSGMWEGFRCYSCGAVGRGKGKDHKIKGVNVTN